MAGLIQEQMGAAPAPGQQMPAGEMPQDMGMPQEMGQMPAGGEDGDVDEENPAFQQALTFAYEALYKNQAAKGVAQQLKSAPSVADGMGDIAFEITSVVDERTDGAVPDELIGVLGMRILEEVGEIAEAAGLDPQPEDVASAFKNMILRFLGEQGVDTTQLQQAMDEVDPADFRKALDEQPA